MKALAPLLLLWPLGVASAPQDPEPNRGFVIFSINVQDFSYPEESAAVVTRILDLHERLRVPVDFYLTTTMTDLYESKAPELLRRLKKSTVASVSYHVRPPCPYYLKYDWAGLAGESPARQKAIVAEYESHGLDLTTGKPTGRSGGYAKLKEGLGYAPPVAACQADPSVAKIVAGVFAAMGAKMFVVHGRTVNLGDRRDGAYLRPEQSDLKLFEHVGEDSAALLDRSFAEARGAKGAVAPHFVGIKMHDNDFFAEKSAWVTVYGKGPRRPNWDPSRKAALIDDSRRKAVWECYERMVTYGASVADRVKPVNAPMVLRMLEGQDAKGTKLYISGTLHIETNRKSWPDPDALVAFFRRATAAGKTQGRAHGMRWSIGADIGWLRGEPRAAEIIQATEALGVEWDIHAHRMADREECAETIRKLGGHPTKVASGVIADELDLLRAKPLEIAWGIVRAPHHNPGNDDNSFGLWRPKSAKEWEVHDPQGGLIAVGGGTRRLEEAEQFAKSLGSGNHPPVLSASIMVSPRTFTIVRTQDGIDAIEAWATRLGARPDVEWATIRETAEAWGKAGGIPSRMTR